MTGDTVYVCGKDKLADADNSCHLCGSFDFVPNGEWGSVQCGSGDGIEGSFVEVHSEDNILQIAEIDIHG